MKKKQIFGLFLKIYLIVLSMTTSATLFARSVGSFNVNISFMGAPRTLSIYVPTDYDSTIKYRLMVCLHGLGDNSDNYRNSLVSSGWPTNITQTIFVCPETLANAPDYYLPAGNEAIIQASINYLKANYTIDASDIVLQGFSVGGRDALRYGLDHYTLFKGLLLNTPAVQGVKEALNQSQNFFRFNYANASKIPVYITHGEDDITYEGPVDTTFRQLVLNNGQTWYFQFPGLGHEIPPINKIVNFIPFFENPATSGHNIDIQNIVMKPRMCDATVPAQVLVRNIGKELVNSITFQYSINGTSQSYVWNGMLSPFQHALISLPALNATTGKQTLNVKIKFLNGNVTDTDSVLSNNSKTAIFEYVDKGGKLPFFESFNSTTVPPANWIEVPQGDYGTQWSIDSTVHEKGVHAAMGAYNSIWSFDNAGRREGIMSPVLDLTSSNNPRLKFDIAYNYHHYTAAFIGIDSSFADTLEVLISTDCGDTWHSLYKKGGKQLATFHDPILNPATTIADLIVPRDTNWRMEEINLSPYAGASSAVIKFNYISNLGGSIYIDNLSLSTFSGIKANDKNQSTLRLFPNPASDRVNIIAGDGNIIKADVIDMSGKEVLSVLNEMVTREALSINTASLPKGLYLFRVLTDKGVNTSKLLLN